MPLVFDSPIGEPERFASSIPESASRDLLDNYREEPHGGELEEHQSSAVAHPRWIPVVAGAVVAIVSSPGYRRC